MKIRFITNLCFELTFADGRRLLTDPWFAEGAFYGSWHNFPPVPTELKEVIVGNYYHWIYISHLHPDHCDKKTLAQFPKNTKIVIGKFPHNHLRRVIEGLGFTNILEISFRKKCDLDGLNIVMFDDFASSNTGVISNVQYTLDTSFLIQDIDGEKIFNCVDNPIRLVDADAIFTEHGNVDVAILPLGGASSYPHAFYCYSKRRNCRKRPIKRQQLFKNLLTSRKPYKPKQLFPQLAITF